MAWIETKKAFPIGTAVKMRHKALACGLRPRKVPTGDVIGKVVGYGKEPELIRVAVDGLDRPVTYHRSFWSSI